MEHFYNEAGARQGAEDMCFGEHLGGASVPIQDSAGL